MNAYNLHDIAENPRNYGLRRLTAWNCACLNCENRKVFVAIGESQEPIECTPGYCGLDSSVLILQKFCRGWVSARIPGSCPRRQEREMAEREVAR